MLFIVAGMSFVVIGMLSKKGGRDRKRFLFLGMGMLIAGIIEVMIYGPRVL